MTKEECLVALDLCDYVKYEERESFYLLLADEEISKLEQMNMYTLMNNEKYKDIFHYHAYYKAWHTKQAILDDMANAGWLI